MMLAMAGLMAELAVALPAAALLADLLLGISSRDAGIYLGVSVVLLFAALLACFVPALGATWVDPIIALRQA